MAKGYEIARCDETVYVRVNGLANMANAPLLDELLRVEIAQGARRACIDLSACQGMDSTFMGLLVGYAGTFGDHNGQLVLVNPAAENTRLLDMLGVSTIVPVIAGFDVPALRFVEVESDERQTPRERAELMVVAHRNLMALSESNRQQFQPFLTALQKDLERFS